jgi:hypothetical protein
MQPTSSFLFYHSSMKNVALRPTVQGYNPLHRGVRTVFVKQTGSGGDRRQATLQILVHADGIQRCKPLLIFHGKDHRQRPKAGNLRCEYRLNDSRVEVRLSRIL